MGVPLPSGVTLLAAGRPELVPWAWAMKGTLSVIGATLAVFIAMNLGVLDHADGRKRGLSGRRCTPPQFYRYVGQGNARSKVKGPGRPIAHGTTIRRRRQNGSSLAVFARRGP